jgi:hypothetical protein
LTVFPALVSAQDAWLEADALGKLVREPGGDLPPADANQTAPGDFYVEPSTLHCLGFEWNIAGDENRNGRVTVRYRKQGADAWREGLDLLRLHRERIATSNEEWPRWPVAPVHDSRTQAPHLPSLRREGLYGRRGLPSQRSTSLASEVADASSNPCGG